MASETPTYSTSTALLDGLHDPANGTVWRAFDDRYRPILARFARLGRRGFFVPGSPGQLGPVIGCRDGYSCR